MMDCEECPTPHSFCIGANPCPMCRGCLNRLFHVSEDPNEPLDLPVNRVVVHSVDLDSWTDAAEDDGA